MDGSHHSKNDIRVLRLRDWKKRGNDEVVVGKKNEEKEELSEEWMGQEKVRGGGQEDRRTVVSAKEWNKEHENVSQRLLPQGEGLGDQPMMKPAGDWRKEEELVLQELPERQQLHTYGRASRRQLSHTYGPTLHPPALEKELEESSYQMGEGGG